MISLLEEAAGLLFFLLTSGVDSQLESSFTEHTFSVSFVDSAEQHADKMKQEDRKLDLMSKIIDALI
jgi:hypothetical protein